MGNTKKGGLKMATRKLLKDQIQKIYRTQDRFAYDIGMDSGILSRIINCTKDPTDDQMSLLCEVLHITEKEINTKHE